MYVKAPGPLLLKWGLVARRDSIYEFSLSCFHLRSCDDPTDVRDTHLVRARIFWDVPPQEIAILRCYYFGSMGCRLLCWIILKEQCRLDCCRCRINESGEWKCIILEISNVWEEVKVKIMFPKSNKYEKVLRITKKYNHRLRMIKYFFFCYLNLTNWRNDMFNVPENTKKKKS